MPRLLLLLLFLVPQVVQACDAKTSEESACQKFWTFDVGEHDFKAAPNVELMMSEYMNPKEPVQNISRKELLRLYKAVRPLAAAAFSPSKAKFEVMIRYSLEKDRPGKLDMRTNAGRPEEEMLTQFYQATSQLTGYHPTNGKVWVLFDFLVSPKSGENDSSQYMTYELTDFPWRL